VVKLTPRGEKLRVLAAVTLAVIVATWLYPPWIHFARQAADASEIQHPTGHFSLFNGDQGETGAADLERSNIVFTIDWQRLVLLDLAIFALSGAIFVCLSTANFGREEHIEAEHDVSRYKPTDSERKKAVSAQEMPDAKAPTARLDAIVALMQEVRDTEERVRAKQEKREPTPFPDLAQLIRDHIASGDRSSLVDRLVKGGGIDHESAKVLAKCFTGPQDTGGDESGTNRGT
jgi:hypothetical protein